MRLPWSLALVLLTPQALYALSPAKRSYDTHNYYVLEHRHQGASLADVTRALGVEVVERAGELPNHWLVRCEKPAVGIMGRDDDSDPVLEKLQHLRNNALSSRSGNPSSTDPVVSSINYFSRQTLRRRVKRAPPPRPRQEDEPPASPADEVALRLHILDPLFREQWHLVNSDYPEHMMNATPVWEMGITGKGVISSLVDDGLDYTNEDLADNFDADNSYDFNDHVNLPTPKLSDDHHGTRCAGQIAAVRNTACGVGIAYDSKVAGVRILSGPISDVDEAAALNYGFQNVSIYSCSWGPPDNGQSMEGPDYLIKKAVVNGINNGRNGLGSVFVFASGNGASSGDQCNFDGYTNSIYSVTVSAVDYKGLHPFYSEPCAANMIVAYSSGSGHHIVTSDKGTNACSKTHGGTSAAAPNAAGVFALALQARPDLTWRDIQHLCVETARMINPDDPGWEATAVGRLYSYEFGFGVLDAYKYITAAQSWKLVKPQAWLETQTIQIEGGAMNSDEEYSGGQFIVPGGVTSKITITKELLEEHNLESLEHINVKVWINHTKRGDVEVELISPNQIKSVLAQKRPRDSASSGFPGWTFMSVKHWGEDPLGDWTIRVSDQGNPDTHNGTFLGWNMIFWGSTIDPSKAKQFEVSHAADTLPPLEEIPPPTTTSAGATKTHPKPTGYLPGDPGAEEDVAVGPTTEVSTPTETAPATISSTPDEGWFSDMSNLVAHQKWFFGAIGLVALFGIGVGAFFWRRRALIRKANYTTLPAGDEVHMGTLRDGYTSATGGGPRTKELYDAFGEVSDDDDADEETQLRGGRPQDRSPGGLSFHSGFLDDDESPIARAPTPMYRDEPTQSERLETGRRSPLARAASPSSGDGSWEHAS